MSSLADLLTLLAQLPEDRFDKAAKKRLFELAFTNDPRIVAAHQVFSVMGDADTFHDMLLSLLNVQAAPAASSVAPSQALASDTPEFRPASSASAASHHSVASLSESPAPLASHDAGQADSEPPNDLRVPSPASPPPEALINTVDAPTSFLVSPHSSFKRPTPTKPASPQTARRLAQDMESHPAQTSASASTQAHGDEDEDKDEDEDNPDNDDGDVVHQSSLEDEEALLEDEVQSAVQSVLSSSNTNTSGRVSTASLASEPTSPTSSVSSTASSSVASSTVASSIASANSHASSSRIPRYSGIRKAKWATRPLGATVGLPPTSSTSSTSSSPLSMFYSGGSSSSGSGRTSAALSNSNNSLSMRDSIDFNDAGSVYARPRSRFANDVRLDLALLYASPLLYDRRAPKNMDALDLGTERKLLFDSLSEAGARIKIRVEVATRETLGKMVAKRPKVLHYSGHGDRMNSTKQSNEKTFFLGFEDGLGWMDPLSVGKLKQLIRPAGAKTEAPFELVFVSACHSWHVGKAFVDAGVPHVVAVHSSTKILDSTAKRFAQHFYHMLVEGNSVLASFNHATDMVGILELDKPLPCRAHLHLPSSNCCFHQHHTSCKYRHQCPASKCPQALCCDPKVPHEEMAKFVLLPEDADHDVGVFDALESGACINTKELAPTNLPVTPYPFVGRNQDLVAINHALCQKAERRLVTVHGMPGIGKTTLAVAVGNYLLERRHFNDGVFMIELRNKTTRDALRISTASALGLEVRNDGELFAALRRLEVLLVMDNCEDPLNAIPIDFRDFLQRLMDTQKVKMLVTSRQVLGIPREHTYSLRNLNAKDTAKLFRDLAAQFLDDQEKDLATLRKHPVLQFCSGVPHATCIAASLLRGRSLEDLQTLIETKNVQALQLDHIPDGQHTTQTSVHQSLEMSLQYLRTTEPQAVVLFGVLGLLPGGAYSEDIDAIWRTVQERAASSSSPSSSSSSSSLDVHDKIWMAQRRAECDSAKRSLVNLSLVQRSSVGERDRYSTLPVVTMYADEHVLTASERTLYVRQIAAHFAERCRNLLAHSVGQNVGVSREIGHFVDAEELNLWMCLDASRVGLFPVYGAPKVDSESGGILEQGQEEGQEEHLSASSSSASMPMSAPMSIGCSFGRMLIMSGRTEEGLLVFERALDISTQLTDAVGRATVAVEYSKALAQRRRSRQALELARVAVELVESAQLADDEHLRADAWCQIAMVLHSMGRDVERAMETIQRAAEQYEKLEEWLDACKCYRLAGEWQMEQSMETAGADAALAMMEKAIALAERTQNQAAMAKARRAKTRLEDTMAKRADAVLVASAATYMDPSPAVVDGEMEAGSGIDQVALAAATSSDTSATVMQPNQPKDSAGGENVQSREGSGTTQNLAGVDDEEQRDKGTSDQLASPNSDVAASATPMPPTSSSTLSSPTVTEGVAQETKPSVSTLSSSSSSSSSNNGVDSPSTITSTKAQAGGALVAPVDEVESVTTSKTTHHKQKQTQPTGTAGEPSTKEVSDAHAGDKTAVTPSTNNMFAYAFCQPLVEHGSERVRVRDHGKELDVLLEEMHNSCKDIEMLQVPGSARDIIGAVASGCRVMHLSCNGVAEEGCVGLEDGVGGTRALPGTRLRTLLAKAQQRHVRNVTNSGNNSSASSASSTHTSPYTLDLVVVCSLYSHNTAQAMVDAGVKHVVAIHSNPDDIEDYPVRFFLRRFYYDLFAGRSVRFAFDSARRRGSLGGVHTCCCAHPHRSSCDRVAHEQHHGAQEGTHTERCCCRELKTHGRAKFQLYPRHTDKSYHDEAIFGGLHVGSVSFAGAPACLNNLTQRVGVADVHGRHADVARVLSVLSRTFRMATLLGCAGVGKSTVARAVCDYVCARHHSAAAVTMADGVFEVSLKGVTKASLVPQRVADAVGLQGTFATAEELAAALHHHQCLILLDDADELMRPYVLGEEEQEDNHDNTAGGIGSVASSSRFRKRRSTRCSQFRAVVNTLLENTRRLKVLLTTRQSMQAISEYEKVVHVGGIAPDACASLFLERMGRQLDAADWGELTVATGTGTGATSSTSSSSLSASTAIGSTGGTGSTSRSKTKVNPRRSSSTTTTAASTTSSRTSAKNKHKGRKQRAAWNKHDALNEAAVLGKLGGHPLAIVSLADLVESGQVDLRSFRVRDVLEHNDGYLGQQLQETAETLLVSPNTTSLLSPSSTASPSLLLLDEADEEDARDVLRCLAFVALASNYKASWRLQEIEQLLHMDCTDHLKLLAASSLVTLHETTDADEPPMDLAADRRVNALEDLLQIDDYFVRVHPLVAVHAKTTMGIQDGWVPAIRKHLGGRKASNTRGSGAGFFGSSSTSASSSSSSSSASSSSVTASPAMSTQRR